MNRSDENLDELLRDLQQQVRVRGDVRVAREKGRRLRRRRRLLTSGAAALCVAALAVGGITLVADDDDPRTIIAGPSSTQSDNQPGTSATPGTVTPAGPRCATPEALSPGAGRALVKVFFVCDHADGTSVVVPVARAVSASDSVVEAVRSALGPVSDLERAAGLRAVADPGVVQDIRVAGDSVVVNFTKGVENIPAPSRAFLMQQLAGTGLQFGAIDRVSATIEGSEQRFCDFVIRCESLTRFAAAPASWSRSDLTPQIAAAGMVASGPVGTVAFGHYAQGNSPGTAAWFSKDGRTWRAIDTMQSIIDGGPRDALDQRFGSVSAVTAYDGGFLAVGIRATLAADRAGTVWMSSDGVNWQTVVESPAVFNGDSPIAVTRYKNEFIVLTENGTASEAAPVTVWRSSNGKDWERTVVTSSGFAAGLASNSNGVVVVAGVPSGQGATLVAVRTFSSTDGRSWRSTGGDLVSARIGSYGVHVHTADSDDIVMVIDSPLTADVMPPRSQTVLRSKDLASWTQLSSPPCATASPRSIAVDVAMSDKRVLLLVQSTDQLIAARSSDNGETWTCSRLEGSSFPRIDPRSSEILTVAAMNGRFVLFGGVPLPSENKPVFQAAVWTEA